MHASRDPCPTHPGGGTSRRDRVGLPVRQYQKRWGYRRSSRTARSRERHAESEQPYSSSLPPHLGEIFPPARRPSHGPSDRRFACRNEIERIDQLSRRRTLWERGNWVLTFSCDMTASCSGVTRMNITVLDACQPPRSLHHVGVPGASGGQFAGAVKATKYGVLLQLPPVGPVWRLDHRLASHERRGALPVSASRGPAHRGRAVRPALRCWGADDPAERGDKQDTPPGPAVRPGGRPGPH